MNTRVIDVVIQQWVVWREATTSMKLFGRLVNAIIASVLISLLWLLPSVVKERGIY